MILPSIFLLSLPLCGAAQLRPLSVWTEELAKLNEIEQMLGRSLGKLSEYAPHIPGKNVVSKLASDLDSQLKKMPPEIPPPPAPDLRTIAVTHVPLVLTSTYRNASRPYFTFRKISSGVIPSPCEYDGWVVKSPSNPPALSFKPILGLENYAGGIYFPPTQNVTCEVKTYTISLYRNGGNALSVSSVLKRSAVPQILALCSQADPIQFEEFVFSPKTNFGDEDTWCIPKFTLFYRDPK
jgi:hypothetical protein